MLSPRNSRIHASALLVLLNTYCTGVPTKPVEAKASPVVIEWVAAGVGAWVDYRLAEPRKLRVDLQAPAGTDHALGWLVPGEVDVAGMDDLTAPKSAIGRMVLNGGGDATEPLVFKDVAPGTYTVCGQLILDGEGDRVSMPVRCARVDVTDAAESRSLVLSG
ncbi:hypothetical protein OV203_06370 [Nannocystis sp. ILAH1]|uniref:hypothetical protein n=1 Tax=Nannocystis sp. ILAH1 TaxID=2996789 RepID=UPI0022713C9A|nr:hypothetical protein [Nannocystis sp. ILAH1]MCY0986736.1 hypothetical protein [Nannocystis sp. ILAH1]